MKKKVLMLGTGGTIASEITEQGLIPGIAGNRFLEYIPEIEHLCQVDCIQVCNLDSTNIQPKDWLDIARVVEERYEEYDGFVITHGTDTMAYTAAAMSYLIQDSQKPIIITGAQKPIHMDSTDSKINLRDSFLCAASDSLSGVSIVFNGKVILGTRARKVRSKSFQAFSSINYPNLAVVQDSYLITYIQGKSNGMVRFFHHMNEKVALLKLIPGTKVELLQYMLEKYDGVIIESFGVGGVPSAPDQSFYEAIEQGIADGKVVVMTTQVPNEGSDLSVYQVGNQLKHKLNVIEAYDMTTEAVSAKLMWILGQTKDLSRVKELFYQPIACDIMIQIGVNL